MKWILILFIVNGYGSSTATAEFNTKAACEVAVAKATSLYGAFNKNTRAYPSGAAGYCIEKGE